MYPWRLHPLCTAHFEASWNKVIADVFKFYAWSMNFVQCTDGRGLNSRLKLEVSVNLRLPARYISDPTHGRTNRKTTTGPALSTSVLS